MNDAEKVMLELKQFVANNGFVEKDKPPKMNEPFYAEWNIYRMKQMGIKAGDRIKVQYFSRKEMVTKYGTGTLLTHLCDTTSWITLMTKGNKVWKERENVEDILVGSIQKVEKLEDGKEIPAENPQDTSEENVVPMPYQQDTIEQIRSEFRDYNEATDYILNINACLYWTSRRIKVKEVAVFICREDCIMQDADVKIKQPYPNKEYYKVCGKRRGQESILLRFRNFKELEKIIQISIRWKMEDQEGETSYLVSNIEPKFIKDENYHIYNVTTNETDIITHYESIFRPTVFSGDIITRYKKVIVLLNEGPYIAIKNKINDSEEMEIRLLLHDFQFEKVACDIDPAKYVEVYVTERDYHADRCLMEFDMEKGETISFDHLKDYVRS